MFFLNANLSSEMRRSSNLLHLTTEGFFYSRNRKYIGQFENIKIVLRVNHETKNGGEE
jgi:hypothetical protein